MQESLIESLLCDAFVFFSDSNYGLTMAYGPNPAHYLFFINQVLLEHRHAH